METDTLIDRPSKRHNQRYGVRLLLQALLKELAIVDTLDETKFPYRLNHHSHYVCFSHSVDKVAVAVSDKQAIGIDVEINKVAWQVARRYYHPSEIAILELLPIARRDYLVKLLWQIKESLIKINQHKLAAGLGVAYPALIKQLLADGELCDDLTYNAIDNSSNVVNNDSVFEHQLAILDTEHTVIVF